jgi:hypothetical protein
MREPGPDERGHWIPGPARHPMLPDGYLGFRDVSVTDDGRTHLGVGGVVAVTVITLLIIGDLLWLVGKTLRSHGI